ncbi:hypothetical protein POTOM_043744 [Populus tomentosa]|uniref:Uncharacterized protein n=1 Tax=Populus tomentosa TaxID=118781 RepID=A0A8X8CET6_POPTO|nr:hypothetical protein POTOM_043744 [Populus tomentosa]
MKTMPGKLFLLLMICRYIFNASWFCPEPYSPNQFASYLDISDQCKSLSTKPSISLGNWHRRKIMDAAFLQHAEENYLIGKSSISHVHQIRLSPSSDTAFNSWWSGYWSRVVPNLSEVQGKLVSRFRVLPNRPIRDELGVFCFALKSCSDEVVLLQDAVKERGTTRAVPTDVEQCRKTLKEIMNRDKIHSLTDSINSANAELDPLCRQNPDFTSMFNQEILNLQDEESNLSEFSCEERSLKTVIETLTAKQESAVFKITSNEKNADKTKQKMGGRKNTDGKVKKDEHICFQWHKEMRFK